MNEEIKDELNDEVDEDIDLGQDFEEAEDDTIEEDVEFDYDDEGNVVIPEESEESAEEDVEEAAEESAEDKTDSSNEADEGTKPEENEAKEPAPNAKDAEIARLKKLLDDKDAQIRDTLKSLGVDENEGMAGLEKLAAEAEDKTVEEYRKQRDERLQQEEAVKLVKKQKFEEKIRADLAAVNQAYPDTKKYKSVYEFPNFDRFGKLRDLGLSPEEAYVASHSQGVIANAVGSAQQHIRNLSNTKSHLRSNVPVGSKDHSITITKREMSEYKEMFPDLSDKEIVALFKQTNKK